MKSPVTCNRCNSILQKVFLREIYFTRINVNHGYNGYTLQKNRPNGNGSHEIFFNLLQVRQSPDKQGRP